MIKHIEEIKVTVERYPNYCDECPMFYQTEYKHHGKRLQEAHCKLGYMEGFDTIDFSGRSLFRGCFAVDDGKMILEESK